MAATFPLLHSASIAIPQHAQSGEPFPKAPSDPQYKHLINTINAVVKDFQSKHQKFNPEVLKLHLAEKYYICPINGELLSDAVSLIGCSDRISANAAQKIFQEMKGALGAPHFCPVCNKHISAYVEDTSYSSLISQYFSSLSLPSKAKMDEKKLIAPAAQYLSSSLERKSALLKCATSTDTLKVPERENDSATPVSSGSARGKRFATPDLLPHQVCMFELELE
jgi:hypothetical protein